jgi:glucan phosphoethanolaminetransferase (alkaline phosphatase superfamily)
MRSHRNTAWIVGVLFIIATVASISTFIFIGFLSDPDYLVNVSANENQVLEGVFLEIIWALAVLGIPVMLYPILRMHNEALALGFYSLRFIEALLTILYSISLLVADQKSFDT